MSVLWKGYFGLVRAHFGECAVEELPGVLKSQVLKIQQPHSPTGGEKQAFVGLINTLQLYNYPVITLINVLWRSYVALPRIVAAVEELS